MTVSYKLQLCSKINANGTLSHYPTTMYLGNIELFGKTSGKTNLALKERADILLSQTSAGGLPKISLEISAELSVLIRSVPYGHRLRIFNDNNLLFTGIAKRISQLANGYNKVDFDSEQVEINDITIAKRDGNSPVFETNGARDIFQQLKDSGWTAFDMSSVTSKTWKAITRPRESVKAGKYINQILTAEKRILRTLNNGTVEVADYAPSSKAIIDIGVADIMENSVIETPRLDRMYNGIDYTYTNSSGESVELQYLGSRNATVAPETYRLRYGLRIATFNFTHLSQADASIAATALLGDNLYGDLMRLKIKIVGKSLELLDRIRLDVPNWNGTSYYLGGLFMVVARTYDVRTNSQDIDLLELTESQRNITYPP